MESILPPYKEFVELEHKTLKLLHDYLSHWQVLAHSAGEVQRCLYQKDHECFRFSIHWDVEHCGRLCRIFLGAEIHKKTYGPTVKHASHCICIMEGRDLPERILRKFHFDYVTERPDRRLPHPRFHLQYCGGLPPGLEKLGVTKDLITPLLPEVDGPRIFFRPVTLGLLMNMAFHEFPCSDTDEIKKRGEWQNLVRDNERDILGPYYRRCAELIGKTQVIFFDHIYV